jgi:ubiquinone biosynthesis protein
MEYLEGHKVDAALAGGHQGPRVARVALRVIFEQIFEQGFFHADPHPGNLLIMGQPEAPVLGMLDLGLVGRLSPALRDKTVDLMLAAVRQDAQGVADALYAIGTPTRKIDRARYDSEVIYLAERYLGKRLEEIEMASLIRDLIHGASKYGLEIPPEFLMLGRTLMTVEGVGKELDPALDVFGELRPLFISLVRRRYSPERISGLLLRMACRFGDTAQTLPARLDELLEDLRSGRVEVRARDPGLEAASDLLGRRLFSGLTVASLVLGGSQLLAAGQAVIGYGLLAAGVTWLLGHGLGARRRAP